MEDTIQPHEWHKAFNAVSAFATAMYDALEGQPIGEDLRERVARWLWQQAAEDTHAIICLIEKRHVGSARALIRPQLESFARGAWALHYASERQLNAILDYQEEFPGIRKLVKEISRSRSAFRVCGDVVPVQQLAERSLDAMHDLTHRGARAIARRSMANSASKDAIHEDEFALFHLAASIGGIATAAFLDNTGEGAKARQIIDALGDSAKSWSSGLTRNPAEVVKG